MTKKNYIKLAEIIKNNSDEIEININWENFMKDLSSYLKYDNPNFDKDTFYKAVEK